MPLVAIDPPRVLKLADTLGTAANDSYLWGQLVGQQVQRCWLDSTTPVVLDELANDLVELGRVLRARAWYADEFRPEFDRLIVGLNSLAAKYLPLAYKQSGVLNVFGSTDASNPTTRVEIFRGSVSADLSDFKAQGVTGDVSVARSYVVEYRRDGTAKITVIDDAAMGIGLGAGGSKDPGGNINGVLPSGALTAEVKARLLAGYGVSYVVPADQVGLFVKHDVLMAATGGSVTRLSRAVGDAIESLPDCVGVGPVKTCTTLGNDAGRLIRSTGDKIGTGIASVFGKASGTVRNLASKLGRRELKAIAAALAYRPPPPLSSFVQAGTSREVQARALAQAVRKFGLEGAAGASSIVGLSTMGTTRALYLNLAATASAEVALGLFDERFDGQAQVQVALVEDAADGSLFADLTLSTVANGDARREAVRIDVRDPNVKAVFEQVLKALLGGGGVTAAVRDGLGYLQRVALRLSREVMAFESSTPLDATIGDTGFEIERTVITRR